MVEFKLRVKFHIWLSHYHVSEKLVEVRGASIIFTTLAISIKTKGGHHHLTRFEISPFEKGGYMSYKFFGPRVRVVHLKQGPVAYISIAPNRALSYQLPLQHIPPDRRRAKALEVTKLKKAWKDSAGIVAISKSQGKETIIKINYIYYNVYEVCAIRIKKIPSHKVSVHPIMVIFRNHKTLKSF